MQNNIPSQLSDHDLTSEVGRLVRCEREATAALVAHLAEFEVRRLYLGAGCRSLFAYCTEVLHLSEYGTYNRIEAARAARRLPVILEMLNDGSLNLATVRILAPHLTDKNHRELLAAATHCSKREVEHLIAAHFPRPAVATLVRKLPARTGSSAAASAMSPACEGRPRSSTPPLATPLQMTAPAPRPTVTPLAADRYQIRFTASAETHRKLRQAQELLGHSTPGGDVAAVMDRALTALLAELSRRKLAATERPRAGGEGTVGNIELRCRSHNAYEADLFYGARRSDGGPNSPRGELNVAHSTGG